MMSTNRRLDSGGRKKCPQIESTLSVVYSVQCSRESGVLSTVQYIYSVWCIQYIGLETVHVLSVVYLVQSSRENGVFSTVQ